MMITIAVVVHLKQIEA